MQRLREEFGCKIGSSTGYTSEIMQKLKVSEINIFKYFYQIYCQPLAAGEGYTPDSYVTSDLVTTGRPSPNMIYLNMINMDIWPAQVIEKFCRGN